MSCSLFLVILPVLIDEMLIDLVGLFFSLIFRTSLRRLLSIIIKAPQCLTGHIEAHGNGTRFSQLYFLFIFRLSEGDVY